MKTWRILSSHLIPTLFVLAVLAIPVLGTGCSSGAVEVGPFAITVDGGSGTISPSVFLPKQTGAEFTATQDQEFCQIPTEDEAAQGVQMVGNINVGKFVRLSRLELVQIAIAATSGDFSFATAMEVRYVPAPVDGQPQDPVVIGQASAPEGFGSTIVLDPPEDVDFLEFIRANDANTSGECPHLEIEVTAKSVPLQSIDYKVEANIDAYAEVGIF